MLDGGSHDAALNSDNSVGVSREQVIDDEKQYRDDADCGQDISDRDLLFHFFQQSAFSRLLDHVLHNNPRETRNRDHSDPNFMFYKPFHDCLQLTAAQRSSG
jgi:hypothetical protein